MTVVRLSVKAQRDIRRKLKVLNHAEQTGNVSKTCRYFGISRDTFYRWKRASREHGEKGLIDSKPCPKILNFALLPRLKKRSFIYVEPIIWVRHGSPDIYTDTTISKYLLGESVEF